MDALAFNAVRKVEDWLLEHPEWFDMTPEELKAALAERDTAIKAAAEAAAAAPAEASEPADPAN